jgi:hypothetical protein
MTAKELISSMGWKYENTETSVRLLAEHTVKTFYSKQDVENKAIHFAEWLTKKHVTTLMLFYEQFEDEEYGGK